MTCYVLGGSVYGKDISVVILSLIGNLQS